MAGVDFPVVLQVVAFLVAIWFGGRIMKRLHQPEILGNLFVGIIMGPQLLDIVPYASNGSCDSLGNFRRLSDVADDLWAGRLLADVANLTNATNITDPFGSMPSGSGSSSCQTVPWMRWFNGKQIFSIWMLMGEVGVTFMIFRSGLQISLDRVWQVGRKALMVAACGTILPIVAGMLLVGGLFGEIYPSGFAAGCAFAPTSLDIAFKLLDRSKMVNTMPGQTTLTAAFLDDVFSLVMLVLVQSLGTGEVSPVDIVRTILCSFAFVALGVVLAIYVRPPPPPPPRPPPRANAFGLRTLLPSLPSPPLPHS